MKTYLLPLLFVLVASCTSQNPKGKLVTENKQKEQLEISVMLKELSREEYPDNPDFSIQSELTDKFNHSKVLIKPEDSLSFDITILPEGVGSDTFWFKQIQLLEFLPFYPNTEDEYLNEIGLINNEWNRQQVKFEKGQFEVSKKGTEHQIVDRLDIARNCLNSGLWEIIAYTKQDGKQRPYYHGWFDFPLDAYEQLLAKRNGRHYEKFNEHLVNWKTPESKALNLDILRKVVSSKQVGFENKNDEFYPLKGERKKKYPNIMSPNEPVVINNFLNDAAVFATFSPPGFYNQAEPRKTQLGRLSKPLSASFAKIKSTVNGQELSELTIQFEDESGDRKTQLVIGGIDLDKIPTVSDTVVNGGWQMPMGIGNHTFYENYTSTIAKPSTASPYYAVLLDEDGKWLDSHEIGIDGPLFHWDAEDSNKLHLWILSFERHAMVGHLVVEVEG